MANKTSRWRTWLNNIPIQDSVDRQMASLLQVILLGFIGILLIAAVVNFLLPDQVISRSAIIIRTTIFVFIIGIPLALLRCGYLRSSVFIIIGILLALETFATLIADLRSIAETLTFFTFAILLAGLFIGRRALFLTFLVSVIAIILNILRAQDPTTKLSSVIIAGNFILLNGLMGLFLAQFGITLRMALQAALEREHELKNEIYIRKQIQAALQQSTEHLEIIHDIDRALISASLPREIAKAALIRIRRLIRCRRASVTLLDLDKNEASFLEADFDGIETIPDTPISLEEFGLEVITALKQNKPWFTNDMLKESEITELDKRLADEDGIHAWLSLPLLYQGQLIGALNLGRGSGESFTTQDAEAAQDIANQLAITIQQSRLHETLQAELVERKNLIAQLEDNNAELERFTYTVSHDLRNPLVTIKGFLGMLNKDIQDNRQDKIQSDFQRIAGAADKMDELLSDLLELSRIGRIVNPPEEVDLSILVKEALELVDARIYSKNITVNIEPDLPVLYGDRLRLREVLENLIANAAKYMGDQPHPIIEIGSSLASHEPIIYVKDNGIGIEQRYQSKIFALFEKLNPGIEGTGIGLALVKRIIEVHGGRIWVESDGPGKGSTFCFTVPNKTN